MGAGTRYRITRHISAEIDPPTGVNRVHTFRVATALAPQPVALIHAAALATQFLALSGRAIVSHQVARQIATGSQQEVAAAIRIPGGIGAVCTAIHPRLITSPPNRKSGV